MKIGRSKEFLNKRHVDHHHQKKKGNQCGQDKLAVGEQSYLKKRCFMIAAIKRVKKLAAGKDKKCHRPGAFNGPTLDGQDPEKCREAAEGDEHSLYKNKKNPLFVEDRFMTRTRRPPHDIGVHGIESQRQGRKSIRDQIHPQNMDGQKRYRRADEKGKKHNENLADVTG